MSSARIPRGYERNSNLVRDFLEISEGQRPALELRPAQYLPVLYQDHYLNDWVVIKAGTIVAVDASGDLVHCNGYEGKALTYTADDVGLTVDFDSNGHDAYCTVSEVGATSKILPSNKPIGVAPYDYFQNINAGFDTASPAGLTKYTNYQIQDKVAVLCDYLIEIPVKTSSPNMDASGTIHAGDLVMSDVDGNFKIWINGTNSPDQIVGRCIQRKSVVAVDNLDKVQTVPGLGLSGSDTAGVPQHLYNYSTSAAYAEKLLIQLMVA